MEAEAKREPAAGAPPQAASRIQTTEPRTHARTRYAESRARSMIAPDMIDAVVHEKSRKARKKTG